MDADRRAVRLFTDRFGEAPALLARAPGRVNLMGDHTDYNDGFVLPVALEQSTWIAARPRDDGRVVCRSEGYDVAEFVVPAADGGPLNGGGWERYLAGVGWALTAGGFAVTGWDGAVASDVPAGAGLSSSAALEVAAAQVYLAADGDAWDATAVALACRRAENEWVGVPSGIMDQLVAAAAVAGHALLVDCRSLAAEPVRLPAGTTVFVLDTTTRRELSHSGYAQRRRDCDLAAARLGVAALRDVTGDDLDDRRDELGPHLEVRARHVVTENARVHAVAGALRTGDTAAVGKAMAASQRSLRDDLEISTPVLEGMVRAARRAPGCWGARMTGGGFGGSAVAVVETARAQEFAAAVTAGFRSRTGLTCAVYPTRGGPGATLTEIG